MRDRYLNMWSQLATVLAVVITSTTDLATMPGSKFLPAAATGLPFLLIPAQQLPEGTAHILFPR